MSINTKKQFQKCLKFYDKNAVVQQNMGEKMLSMLSQYEDNFANILELGCGTGFLTQKIVQNFQYDNYYANDFVEDVEKYLPSGVNFISGDMNIVQFPNNVDLIISNAVFQWFSNIDTLIEKISQSISLGGYFAFSTFTKENFIEIKNICGLSLEYKSEEELRKILKRNFEILDVYSYKEILEFSTPLDILKHMKNTGVNSLNSSPWGVKQIHEFCKKYCEIYEKSTLTYAPIIVIAKKK